MKTVLLTAFLFTSSAFGLNLTCVGHGEKFNLVVSPDKVEGYWDGATRETQDPDCVYRADHYACYEDGQLMINVALPLLTGKAKQGKVWIQTDTGDNADAHNHALLGEAYLCTVQ